VGSVQFGSVALRFGRCDRVWLGAFCSVLLRFVLVRFGRCDRVWLGAFGSVRLGFVRVRFGRLGFNTYDKQKEEKGR